MCFRNLRRGCFLLFVLVTSTALAQAVVHVRVRVTGVDGESAIDGRLTMTSTREGAESRSCVVQNGNCDLPGVQGGRYSVVFVDNEGAERARTTAMVPPSGEVVLHVSAH